MVIETKSGSVYEAELRSNRRGPVLFVRKEVNGHTTDWWPAVAIYADRLPHLMDTVSVEPVSGGPFVVGRNANGRQTFRLIPDQIRKGMVLANRRGFRSTEIVKIS